MVREMKWGHSEVGGRAVCKGCSYIKSKELQMIYTSFGDHIIGGLSDLLYQIWKGYDI